jgi:hypothetical protein
MKIVITEKQLKLILSKEIGDIDEESTTPATSTPSTPSTPSSSSIGSSSTASSYPSVTKWESGVTRGPGNPFGNTKWADNYKITRVKGNPLT